MKYLRNAKTVTYDSHAYFCLPLPSSRRGIHCFDFAISYSCALTDLDLGPKQGVIVLHVLVLCKANLQCIVCICLQLSPTLYTWIKGSSSLLFPAAV